MKPSTQASPAAVAAFSPDDRFFQVRSSSFYSGRIGLFSKSYFDSGVREIGLLFPEENELLFRYPEEVTEVSKENYLASLSAPNA